MADLRDLAAEIRSLHPADKLEVAAGLIREGKSTAYLRMAATIAEEAAAEARLAASQIDTGMAIAKAEAPR